MSTYEKCKRHNVTNSPSHAQICDTIPHADELVEMFKTMTLVAIEDETGVKHNTTRRIVKETIGKAAYNKIMKAKGKAVVGTRPKDERLRCANCEVLLVAGVDTGMTCNMCRAGVFDLRPNEKSYYPQRDFSAW